MLNIGQFRELIVKSTLNDLVLYSKEAEEILIFTCAVETQGGTYLKQIDGPALGIFQMEPMTYNDIWQNFIKNRSSLCLKLLSNFNVGFMPEESRLIYDLRFATAMARIHYLRVREPLPRDNDPDALWFYYKLYYNTSKGLAEKSKALESYARFITS